MHKNIAGIVRNKWSHLEKKYFQEALHFYQEVIFINPEQVIYRYDRQRNTMLVLYHGMALNDLAMLYTLGRVEETLLLVKCLEMCGCPVSDPYKTISRDCLEKLTDSLALFSDGVGTTGHVFMAFQPAREYLEQLEARFFPLLNKPIAGNRGKGIVPLYSSDQAIEFSQEHFKISDAPLVFEQLMKYSHEYRVYVVDGKTVEAYEKVRTDEAIVMNLHQGATPQRIEDSVKKEIFDFLDAHLPQRYQVGVFGVDLATTLDGSYHVIEVNRTPGFGGLRKLGLLNFPRYVHEVVSQRARKVDTTKERGGEYILTLLGDTNPGETYQQRLAEQGKGSILLDKGYDFSFSRFGDFLGESDFTLINLEVCITSLRTSPFADDKPYLDWTDVEETPKLLQRLHIDAVSLANNHALDFGAEGMVEALQILQGCGIASFGAGVTDKEAAEVLHHYVPAGNKTLHIIIASGYEFQRPHIRRGYYATASSAGVNLWSPENAARQVAALRAANRDAFIIAYPHWGSNYYYVVDRQRELGHSIIDAGADLIVGHGSHMMQEIEVYNGRWIIYGLGNFVYNSPGRYGKHDVLPFGLLGRLLISEENSRSKVTVQLYPTHLDNLVTGYQSHFVTERQFRQAVDFFMPDKGDKTGLEQRMRAGKDKHGFYFAFDIPWQEASVQ
jgi:poly-gamma-glutamate capsule biosynthesis protein CapA/YwtB (metallophosphatase superfamily)/glutathione synthase/RimK-type ligase-like ATP-grasp enzyme